MKLSFDIDGVLADFESVTRRAVQQLYCASLPNDYQMQEWSYGELLKPEQWACTFEYLLRHQELWLDVPAYEHNVQALLRYIVLNGDEDVYYITARQDCAGGSAVSMTQLWLMDQGLNFHNLHRVLSADQKKSKIEELGIDLHLDDYGPTVVESQPRAILLSHPYNAMYPFVPWVTNVTEFLLEASRERS